jgi:hypothetical protein
MEVIAGAGATEQQNFNERKLVKILSIMLYSQ